MYFIKCGDDSKSKLKGFPKVSQKLLNLKNITFVFWAKNQQECENYLIRSPNHEMYLQRVNKSTLYQFDDKRCYKKN